ncbi:Tyrosine-protein phosphatase precursor [uncultured Eubacterium sp.]|nr:Tyrosine-protein phosphatase precursor [uncultured Eubacterium sp.]
MKEIILEGTDNIRDFANTVNKKGCLIRPGKLLRSRHLHTLTGADIAVLKKEHHLSKVIDLRTKTEMKDKPDQEIAGVISVWIPLIEEETVGITHETSTDKNAEKWVLPDMRQLYRKIVTDDFSINQLSKTLKTIVHCNDGAVLWHCTEGKDRCGIISALVLSLLDVDRETIFEDYLMTNQAAVQRADAAMKMVLQKTGDEEKAQMVRRIFLADEKYLQAAFDAIEEKNESIAAFFANRLGISEAEKRLLQEKCLLK